MPRLSSLAFDVDPRAQDGWLALRANASDPLAVPEWDATSPGDPARSPVGLVLSEVGPGGPRMRVTVDRENGDPDAIEVRALPVVPEAAPLPPETLLAPDLLWPASHWFSSVAEYASSLAYRAYYDLWQASRTSSPPLLGAVEPTAVRFGGTGRATVDVTIGGQGLEQKAAGAHEVGWRWQSRDEGRPGDWSDLVTTRHRVYTVLAAPTSPWHRVPEHDGDTQVPWAEALEVACRWASGARDLEDAAAAVTEAVNALGGELLEYGCPIGALTMYASPLGLDLFDCSAFLERLEGGAGNGRYVNCTDCATIVSTFANLLGCDLWQSRMGSYDPPFLTNPVFAIGSTRLGSPCGWGLGFTYHEVAWTGGCGEDDDVYDACVRVVSQVAEPGTERVLVPAGVRFGAEGEGQYRDQIAAPTGRAACSPRPQERKRRRLL